jgi:hypothetical protein
MSTAVDLYPSLRNIEEVSISWIDDDGDKVIVSSDPETEEAIRVMGRSGGPIRFIVQSQSNNNATPSDAVDPSARISEFVQKLSSEITTTTMAPNYDTADESLLQSIEKIDEELRRSLGRPSSTSSPRLSCRPFSYRIDEGIEPDSASDYYASPFDSSTPTAAAATSAMASSDTPTKRNIPLVTLSDSISGMRSADSESFSPRRRQSPPLSDRYGYYASATTASDDELSGALLSSRSPRSMTAAEATTPTPPPPPTVTEETEVEAEAETEVEAKKEAPQPRMRFICDISFPAGTTIEPGIPFRKTWRIRNEGESPWPDDVRLQCVAGGDLMMVHANGHMAIPSLDSGEESEISVPLIAPPTTGRYCALFQVQTKEGRSMGRKLEVDIQVTTEGAEVTSATQTVPVFQVRGVAWQVEVTVN